MNLKQLVTWGLDQEANGIMKVLCKMSRNDRLLFMREMQEGLARYSKGCQSEDAVQRGMVKHVQLVETLCRRMDVMPEIKRRMKNDPRFWKIRDGFIRQYGSITGEKKANKWIKTEVNNQWEREVRRKFAY